MSKSRQLSETAPLLRVEDVRVHYPVAAEGWLGSKRVARSVDGVSLTLERGETLGIVGESGSGKTTIGRAILRRAPLTSGRIHFRGQDITDVQGEDLRQLRRHMQLVFQDPSTSLNPRQTVFESIAEPLIVHKLGHNKAALETRVAQLIKQVGLPADAAGRYPHAFSGGQRQRIGIARALAIEPELIVADEPVSALDVSVRAQVINLFQDLQAELGLGLILIAHDLAVVKHIAHRIAIMYGGLIVETGPRDSLYDQPVHPYTQSLLAAVPEPIRGQSKMRTPLAGEPSSPMSPPSGCRFHPRCPIAKDICSRESPTLEEKAPGHFAACWVR